MTPPPNPPKMTKSPKPADPETDCSGCFDSPCVRILVLLFFVIFNGIILFLGICLLNCSLELYVQAKLPLNNAEQLVATNSVALSFLMLALALIILSLIGIIGVIKFSPSLLNFYASVFLFFCLLFAVYYFVMIFTKKGPDNGINIAMKENFIGLVKNFKQNRVSAESLQNLQMQMKCCGWNGSADFNGTIPSSCCNAYSISDNPLKTCNVTGVEYFHGCKDSIPTGSVIRKTGDLFSLFVICYFLNKAAEYLKEKAEDLKKPKCAKKPATPILSSTAV